MLSILRYANEVRDAGPYFDATNADVDKEAVALAKQLVQAQSSKFEPEKMPDEYAVAVKELIRAKVEQRAPEIAVGKGNQPAPK
jgi:DNA end-binding protein Ku